MTPHDSARACCPVKVAKVVFEAAEAIGEVHPATPLPGLLGGPAMGTPLPGGDPLYVREAHHAARHERHLRGHPEGVTPAGAPHIPSRGHVELAPTHAGSVHPCHTQPPPMWSPPYGLYPSWPPVLQVMACMLATAEPEEVA